VIHAIGAVVSRGTRPVQPVVDVLLGGDRYFHCADFASYLECQTRVAGYGRPDDWIGCRSGTWRHGRVLERPDRAQYARDVWGVSGRSASPAHPGGR
jgi:hypothetical protein